MNKRTKILVPLAALAFALSIVLVPKVTWAHAGHDHSADTAQTDGEVSASDESKERAREKALKLKELREAAAKERLEAMESAKERMTDAQKEREAKQHEKFQKACENRRDAYKKRLGNVNDRVKKHVETLDNIVDRVDTFVTDKNLTVPNYDALLAEAKTQRELVRTLHQALVEKAEAFDCGNSKDEAKAALAAFKDAFKQEVDALKAYKAAVKDLVAAVKATAPKEGASDES